MVTQAIAEETPAAGQVARLRAIAYRLARRYGLRHDDAVDAADEVLVCMLEATDGALTPPPGVKNADAWLRGCARRRVIDVVRSTVSEAGHRGPSLEPDDPDRLPARREEASQERTPEEAMLLDEAEHAIAAAIDALDTQEHLDFIDAYLIDIPVAQIALETGRTSNAVYKELARTRVRILRLLEEQGWTEAEIRRALDARERGAARMVEASREKIQANPTAEG